MIEIKTAVKSAVVNLFGIDVEPELTRPDEQFGDYSTNVALQLAGQLQQNPKDIAQKLALQLKDLDFLVDVQTAGPGFINFKLTDQVLSREASEATRTPKKHSGQEIVIEYSDPNPFKVLHVGHLYTSVVGDSVAKLLEASGANVHRVNFGGDVGLHVAKTMWAVLKRLGGEHSEKLSLVAEGKGAEWLTEAYVEGNRAYEEDETAKSEIKELNTRIYKLHEDQDHDSELAKIYWHCREWSYSYFESFYSIIGSQFEKYYPESETVGPGLEAVRENIGKVFEESDGAVVFKGEVHNLHTRVFINSQGLPTYETKDVGLLLKKWQDYHFDRSVVITGNEIYEYMQVVLKAVEQFAPELVQKTTHITHGMVKLIDGEKMSSRKGNILKATEVIGMVEKAGFHITGQKNIDITLGAIKYAFLKNRIGADILFSPDESVSLEGNSGPYLQYAHARARTILAKSDGGPEEVTVTEMDGSERSLARKISEYGEVVDKATEELMPHHIANYLYELSQNFNRFYEKSRVIGDERQSLRFGLVRSYADVLKHGLGLLNIPAPEKV